jgi:hypothetical protein
VRIIPIEHGLNLAQLSWAAGLFEGEGCFVLGKGNGRYPHTRNVRAVLASTDIDVLLRFQAVVGFGKISSRKTIYGAKPVRVWNAGSFEHFQATVAFFWPWLGERRRERARECLLAMREYYAAGGHQRGVNRRRR